MNFLPLKHYYRSLAVALIVPLLVAFILCLHLYNLKLERSQESRQSSFNNISAQLGHAMHAADGLIDTMFKLYEQPLSYDFDPNWARNVNQFDHYYYQPIKGGVGEIVGQGKFASTAFALTQWRQVLALGPSFNTTLALIQSLQGVAYVNEQGFVYIKRRSTAESELLTSVLDNKFRPSRLNDKALASSAVITVNGHAYFAIGKRRALQSDDYIILIYDLEAISKWLMKTAPSNGEYIFINQDNQVIASSSKILKTAINADDYWPESEINKNTKSHSHLVQPSSDLPIYTRYFESQKALSGPVRYDMFIEFVFLSVFLVMMFSAVFWLSQRIFVKPMTHLMNYLEKHDEGQHTLVNYRIPADWQPWFSRVKRVFTRNEELVQSLQEANKALDSQVQVKSKQLRRSIDAKERHLALLNTMLNNVPDLIYFKNIDGSFLGCNKAYESYIGLPQEKLVGQQLCDISDDNGELSELERQVLQDRQVYQKRLVTNDKTYHLSIAPFYNEHQQLLGTMAIGRDITEQHAALNALQSSEAKLRSAMEYAANGVILLSLDYRVLQMNKAARKIFSLERSDTLSSQYRLDDLFGEQSLDTLKGTLLELLSEKKKVYHFSLPQQEQKCWLQISVSLVWNGEKNPDYFVVHVQDITDLIQAKNDAERATLAKSRFIANLSHEIRTPLNAVLGLIDVIALQGLSLEQRTHAEQAKSAANSLLSLLNRMLDFARAESSQVKLTKAPFSLSDLINYCEGIVAPLCKTKGLEFSVECDEKINSNLRGDQICLQQVLGNLLTNAAKFTEQGSVKLSLNLVEQTSEQQLICFAVKDTGIGISDADQSRLFDAFTQGDESLTRSHQGVGLGLAIVKYEVALMGGEIKLASQRGKGSEFSFCLQLDKTSEPAKKAVVSLPSSADLSGLLVLAVDDNPLNLSIIKSILEQADITVVCADSGEKGIELANCLRPDLIFMDIQMPQMDGCQATRIIRQSFTKEQMPIYALTAHSEAADIEQSVAAGMNKHLTKPIVASTLFLAMSELEVQKQAFFDRTFVLTQFSNNTELVLTMLSKFATMAAQQLLQISTLKTTDELIRVVHNVKGSAGNLGFKRLSACAQQCEAKLKAQGELPELLNDELQWQIKQVIAFIIEQGSTDAKKSQGTDC
ncbi:PAS domain-containing hybrid sensor histidine kinase/response regulator [Pseudoalteromonas sp. bablab_jr011]|uniref:PAS domain-containing hybrid sensor histidine kinase/response regulator n=1 Tax=Pseudoalteromonas sp. bablab_jr011 TaxID=2755062 RepID=UPI0018F6995A|nr:PAS domain-containing hybrid sensor histidine kinase/response regulator [Pseudoalteromonas sp. bablab_jr011]